MKTLSTLILSGFILIASGCAPKIPLTYNPENSKALNIVKAAGMDYGLKDVKAPKDTVTDIRDSKSFGAAYGLASYYSPTPGLSSSGSAGMAILSWALLPKTPAARNSIIAWMPADIDGDNKEDALDKMADIIIDATEKAARDLKYNTNTYIGRNGTDKRGLSINLTNNESEKCSIASNDKNSFCNIVYKVRYPHKIDNTAQLLTPEQTRSYLPQNTLPQKAPASIPQIYTSKCNIIIKFLNRHLIIIIYQIIFFSSQSIGHCVFILNPDSVRNIDQKIMHC